MKPWCHQVVVSAAEKDKWQVTSTSGGDGICSAQDGWRFVRGRLWDGVTIGSGDGW
jgi:hypothetical protein